MRITRPLAALAATTMITGLVGLLPADAAPTYDPRPVKSGAGWLAGELTDGLVHNEQFDFDDVGLSIDVALGLDAAGKKPLVVKTVTRAVAKNLEAYIGFAPEEYAGPTAKTIVLAVGQDKDPRAFGGLDLVSRLEGRVAATAPIAGRIEDKSEFGDFANVIGQTYAAQALSLVKSPQATPAVAFLLQQQCAKGYFRQYFTTDKTRPDQSCQGAPRKERGASTDATALAILALQDVKGPKAKAAAKDAVAWLLERQGDAFSDTGKSTGTYNTNSTGLAGWALGEAGATRRAARAAEYVRSLQVPAPNPCAGRLVKETGAIAYDTTAYGAAQDIGIKNKDSDQWRRASAQALPVLQWAPRAEGEFTATAPRTVAAGDLLIIRVTGAAKGERICVSGAGSTNELVTERSTRRVWIKATEGAGSRTYTVWLGSQRRTVTVRVTG